jgi:hypothetical protein
MPRRTLLVAALAFVAATSVAQAAETMYAASVSGYNAGSTEIGAGVLYTIDPATAAATRVATIRAEGRDVLGITGLAFHPATGVLYGITAGLSPNIPHSLVSVDPKTGDAKVIGALNVVGSDISFDADGKLYMWIPSLRQIGEVNLQTAAIRLVGSAGTAVSTGGLSIDNRGTVMVVGSGNTPRIDNLDSATGDITRGPPLANAPYSAFNSLTLSPRGILYAVNSNMGAPASTRLVTIDRKTGEVHNIGALPPDTDALAFRPESAAPLTQDFNWTPILIALGVIVTLVTVVFTTVRPRQR